MIKTVRYCGYGNTPSTNDDAWVGTPQVPGNVPLSWDGNVEADDLIQFVSAPYTFIVPMPGLLMGVCVSTDK